MKGLTETQRYGVEYRTLRRLAADIRGVGLRAEYKGRRVRTGWGTYLFRWSSAGNGETFGGLWLFTPYTEEGGRIRLRL